MSYSPLLRISIILNILKMLVELACYICVFILCGLSRKNPLESHIIGDLSNYFFDAPKNSTNANIINTKSIFLKNNLKFFKRYNKLYSEEKKKNLRHLVSRAFCSEIRQEFESFKGTKLSNIFDINYKKIRNFSIAIVVVFCVGSVFSGLGSVLTHYTTKENIINFFFVSILIFYEARFVLSLLLLYYIGKGDIEKYDDFLDCRYIRTKTFDKFSDVNKLKNCFIAFFILNIISQGIDKIEKLFDFLEKMLNESDQNSK